MGHFRGILEPERWNYETLESWNCGTPKLWPLLPGWKPKALKSFEAWNLVKLPLGCGSRDVCRRKFRSQTSDNMDR